jgi:IMP dehydrogenase/GMP reductase
MPSYKTKWHSSKDKYDETDFKPKHPRHRHLRHSDIKDDEAVHLEDMIEGIFTESKVDKIIEGYFKYDNKEKQLLESKTRNEKLLKEDRKQKITKIKQLSESISQEVGSTKFLNQNPTAKLIGKTNKKNLVFEMKGNQFRVNTKGQVI